ncbi:YdbL family protein [Thermodesulfobacteriota bacterium]
MMLQRMRLIPVCFILLALCFLTAESAQAAGVKERMRTRLPAINGLKAQGVIGETIAGYLDFVGKNRPKADLVAAENKDRRKVYTAIAKQQGVTVDVVGKRRALQIKKRAPAGSWFQSADGQWYQK